MNKKIQNAEEEIRAFLNKINSDCILVEINNYNEYTAKFTEEDYGEFYLSEKNISFNYECGQIEMDLTFIDFVRNIIAKLNKEEKDILLDLMNDKGVLK